MIVIIFSFEINWTVYILAETKSLFMKAIRQSLILGIVCLLGLSFHSQSQVGLKLSKPLSKADKDQVEKILSEFDPQSYSFSGTYKDENKREKSFKTAGRAVGLANVKQSDTKINSRGTAASTNTNNNIFKQASTNTNNNIFKTASTNTNNNIFKVASTNTNNNIFKQASTNTNNNIFKQAATNTNNNIFKEASEVDNKLNQLYTILQKYQ
jgi:hypothetical protein